MGRPRGRPRKYQDTTTAVGRVDRVKRDLLLALGYSDAMVYERGADEILQASLNAKGGLKSEVLIKMQQALTSQKGQIDFKLEAISQALEGINAEEAKEEKKLKKFRKAFSQVMGGNGNIDYYYKRTPKFDHYGSLYSIFEDRAKDISIIAKMPVTAEMVIKEVEVRWREQQMENEEGQDHGASQASSNRKASKVDI